jgi:hypothetical protein
MRMQERMQGRMHDHGNFMLRGHVEKEYVQCVDQGISRSQDVERTARV